MLLTPQRPNAIAPYRITVADAHPLVLLALRVHLDALPNVKLVSVCKSGTELIDMLSAHPSDLVITDIVMSRNDAHEGLELLSFLNHHFPQTQVLIFSGHASPSIIRHIMGLGLGGFVSKVDPIDELFQAVIDLQNKRKAYYSTSVRASASASTRRIT